MPTYSGHVMSGAIEHWSCFYNVLTVDVDVVWSADRSKCDVLDGAQVNLDYGGLPFWRAKLDCADPQSVAENAETCPDGMECQVIHCELEMYLIRFVKIQQFKETFSIRVCADGTYDVFD